MATTKRMAARVLAWVLLSFAFSFVALSPADAQEKSTEREHLILKKLPGRGSEGYGYLRDIAGDMAGESLVMSQAEVWSVPKDRMDMLVHAAEEQGTSIEVVRSDFNEVITAEPMPDGMKESMSPAMSSMVDAIKAEPAFKALSMIAVQPQATLEYALARGEKPMLNMRAAELSATSDIVLGLPDGEKITVSRMHVETTRLGCVWHGRIAGSVLPVSLMWWPDGRMTGSFAYKNNQYLIRNLGGEQHALIEIDPKMLPPEHESYNGLSGGRDRAEGPDRVVRTGEAIFGRDGTGRDVTGRAGASQTADHNVSASPSAEEIAALLPPKSAGSTATDTGSRTSEGKVRISVLVAYSARAAARYTNIKNDLISLAIEQTNESFRASKIDTVEVELAAALPLEYDDSSGNHFNHLWRMVDRGDGFMENIHQLRDEHRADVVVLVVDSPTGCGLATRVAARSDEAFAVIDQGCATTTFSFAHEIGHLIGARHDRALDSSTKPFPYGHGHVEGLKWRTLMSYANSCSNCPRLPLWSSPRVDVAGNKAGASDTDNARVIAEQAARVAAFR